MSKAAEDMQKLQQAHKELLQKKAQMEAKAAKDPKAAGSLIAIQRTLKKVGDALVEFGEHTAKEATFGAYRTSKEKAKRKQIEDRLTGGGMQAVVSTPDVFVGGGKDARARDLPSGFMGSTLIVIRHGIEVREVPTVDMERRHGPFKPKPVKAYNLGDKGMKLIKNKADVDGWLSDNADTYIVRFDARGADGRQISDSTGQTVYKKGSESYEVMNATIPLPVGKSEIWVSCEKFQGVMLDDEKYEVINTGLAAAKVGVHHLTGLAGASIEAGLDIEPNMVKELTEALTEAAEPFIEPIKQAIEAIHEANDAEKTQILTFNFTPTGGEGLALDCGTDEFTYDGYPDLVGRGVKIGDVADRIKSAIPK